MAFRRRIPLPKQWSAHVKSGVLHAISLAGFVLTAARARALGRHRLRVELEQARTEIALLREELSLKDGRWERSRPRRRPHYAPRQRMRILQLRAARGWSLEQTGRVFLVDLQTLMHWMRRLDESGARALIQTVAPVNRYPDVVRGLVHELKRLYPETGCERLAHVLARAGLRLGATTIRRIEREDSPPPEEPARAPVVRRRRVVGKHPGHTWHVDLTTVPTRAGFWVPWLPCSIPLAWPFCWWVAVAVDQVSRIFVGFAVFPARPSSVQLQRFLERAVQRQGSPPSYIITDKEKMFRAKAYRRWCKRRGVRPRYGALGQPASIPLVERFIRSLKQECTRRVLVSLSLDAMRREIDLYGIWYNTHRPHAALRGRTPREVYESRLAKRRRLEPRPKWPHGPRHGERLRLAVSYVEGRRHLPIIDLRRAA